MDGTLVDSSELLANTINYVREEIGLPRLDDGDILRAINDNSCNPARYFYESEAFEEIHEKLFHSYYTKHHHTQSRLYEGVGPLLEQLARNRRLSVATNAYDLSAKPLLEALGIDHYFDYVLCGNQVAEAKPHPMMLERIIDAYDVDREAFVMIGDGERDIIAAERAGIDALLVEWGFSDHEEAIASVGQLRQLLGV